MSFRLVNASAIFQRHIMFILRKVLRKEVMIYLDDILIVSSTREKYKKKIKRVLKLLIKNDLHKKKEKYKYF